MSKKSVLVIGSGLSGLSTGIFAQRSGYKSTLFEQHYHAGGFAASWKRKEFIIDGGIYYLVGCKPGVKSYDILKEVGVGDTNLYIPMQEYASFIDESSGARIRIGRDIGKLEKDLKAMAPKDSALIEEVIKVINGLRGKDISTIGMLKPPELQGFLGGLKTMWEARHIMKYMGKKYSQPMGKFVESAKTESLKYFLNGLFSPDVPVWFSLLIVASLADGQLALIKNGCKAFVDGIKKEYSSLGGEIKLKSKVTKILTKDNKACGIQLASGEQIMGDYIVSASDTERTIYKLLEGKYTTPDLNKIHNKWKASDPWMLASYAVSQEFKQEPILNHLHLKEPINYGDKQVRELTFRIMKYGDYAPKGKTVVQALLTTDWAFWEQLYNDKVRYAEEKRKFTKEVLERLNNHYPGIKERVEVANLATPCTMHRFTLSKGGSANGWGISAETLAKKRYRTIPGLKNFYMAGQWAFAPGVTSALYSGKHVVDLINHNY